MTLALYTQRFRFKNKKRCRIPGGLQIIAIQTPSTKIERSKTYCGVSNVVSRLHVTVRHGQTYTYRG